MLFALLPPHLSWPHLFGPLSCGFHFRCPMNLLVACSYASIPMIPPVSPHTPTHHFFCLLSPHSQATSTTAARPSMTFQLSMYLFCPVDLIALIPAFHVYLSCSFSLIDVCNQTVLCNPSCSPLQHWGWQRSLSQSRSSP